MPILLKHLEEKTCYAEETCWLAAQNLWAPISMRCSMCLYDLDTVFLCFGGETFPWCSL